MSGGITVGNKADVGITHVYKLSMRYLETGIDQSDDMNKAFSAKINIKDIKEINPYTSGTLAYSMINNSAIKKNGTALLASPEAQVAESVAIYKTGNITHELDLSSQSEWYYGPETNPGPWGSSYSTTSTCSDALKEQYIMYYYETPVYKVKSCKSETVAIVYEDVEETAIENTLSVTQDDYGTSYYYRGAVEDNYMDFAGMCWRIVRIQGDGSIKLVLEDKNQTCKDSNGDWDIITQAGSTTGNFGYDNSTSGLYKMTYLNPVTNATKSMISAFYKFQTADATDTQKSLKGYTNYLKGSSADENPEWCLNDRAYAETTGTTLLSSSDVDAKYLAKQTFYYDSRVRLVEKNPKEPTLRCNGTKMNKYANVTSGSTTITTETDMLVGALTADEVVYAGGKVGESNTNYYLINDYQTGNGKYFWTLSPSYFNDGSDYAFRVYENGYVYDGIVNGNYPSLRPAVSLKSGTQVTGEGTKTKPYTIAS